MVFLEQQSKLYDLQAIIGNGHVGHGSATATQETKGKSNRGEQRSCASPMLREKAKRALQGQRQLVFHLASPLPLGPLCEFLRIVEPLGSHLAGDDNSAFRVLSRVSEMALARGTAEHQHKVGT